MQRNATRRPVGPVAAALVGVVLGSVALVGCAASGEIRAVSEPVLTGDPRPEGGASTGDGAPEGACTLVTAADLSELGIDAELADGEDRSDEIDPVAELESSACQWSVTTRQGDAFLTWSISAVVERGGDSGTFEEMVADPFADNEPEPIEGLGDRAAYGAEVFVEGPDLQNWVVVQVGADVVRVENLEEKVIGRAQLLALAERVVGRLGG